MKVVPYVGLVIPEQELMPERAKIEGKGRKRNDCSEIIPVSLMYHRLDPTREKMLLRTSSRATGTSLGEDFADITCVRT
jgi:hypothetical protein